MHEISITELQNLKIGQAENAQAGTGCTVFLLGENGAPVGLDVRGGGPASRESELLKPTAAAQVIHAILLGGGSAFGLDAAGGATWRNTTSVLTSASPRCRWSASPTCST